MLRKLAPIICLTILWPLQVGICGQARRPGRRRGPAALPGTLILKEDFEKGIEGWNCIGKLKLVEDAKQAHTGKGCLLGEVTKDRQANFFERKLDFKQSSIYRLVVWARSEGRGKFVLWCRAGKARRMLGVWQNVPRQWRRQQFQFSMPQDGPVTLQLIVPSSHGAPVCKMWIDDVSLFETAIPSSTDLTQNNGHNSDPALATDAAGRIWASWLSYRDGRDALRCGLVETAKEGFRLAKEWQVPMPSSRGIMRPELIPNQNGAWLLCTAEVRGNWDVYLSEIAAEGPSSPRRITTHTAVDVKPAAAVLNGKVWIAWESNPGPLDG